MSMVLRARVPAHGGDVGIPPKTSTKSLSSPSIGTRRTLKDLSVLGCTPPLPTLASKRRSQQIKSKEYTWPTTKILTKDNRAKKSRERCIIIQATCLERPPTVAKTILIRNPTITLTRYKTVARDKNTRRMIEARYAEWEMGRPNAERRPQCALALKKSCRLTAAFVASK